MVVLHARGRLQSPGHTRSIGRGLLARSRPDRFLAGNTPRRRRVGQTEIHTTHRRYRGHRLGVNRLELWSQAGQDSTPALALADRQTTCTRGELEDKLGPSLESCLGDVQAPSNRLEKHQLILVDLQRVQAGDLTPGTSGVVAVLEILGRQDQCGQKHPTTTLHRPHRRLIAGLLFCEVVARHMGFNLNQIIKSHLQGAIASS